LTGSLTSTWAQQLTNFLLPEILAIGQELDRRSMKGADVAREGSLVSWACQAAPVAGASSTVSSRQAVSMIQVIPEMRTNSMTIWHCNGAGPEAMTACKSGDIAVPRVQARLSGMIVILKPVNWEVDGCSGDGSGAHLLSEFVQGQLPYSDSVVVHTRSLDYGFIHRLDVPSSGLVLCGTNFEGLFKLKWQLSTYSIDRQYFTLNHGHMCVTSIDITKRIDATTFEFQRSLTTDAGKPARTHLRLVGHHYHDSKPWNCIAGIMQTKHLPTCNSEVDLCALAISIHTGRRHQIRAHTRFIGHPTLADALYTPKEVMVCVGQVDRFRG